MTRSILCIGKSPNVSSFSRLVLLIIGFHLALSIGQAQSAANSGQIGGEVRDPSGAAVPGVEVTARNIDTNAVRTVSTDEEGRYKSAFARPPRDT